MRCDRCDEDVQEGTERRVGLVTSRRGRVRIFRFNLCGQCSGQVGDRERVDPLGRNMGARELQEMARRMPGRMEEREPPEEVLAERTDQFFMSRPLPTAGWPTEMIQKYWAMAQADLGPGQDGGGG